MPSTLTTQCKVVDQIAEWTASVAAQKLATGASLMVSTFNHGNTPNDGQTRDTETAMADLLDAIATIKTEQASLDAISRRVP
jgi:hypothetical protein